MRVRDVLDAMEKDKTPKSKEYFSYEGKSCAIGGAADILEIDARHLAMQLMAIEVPEEEGDKTNLLSPNYSDYGDAWKPNVYMRPTLRKRIEFLSDATSNSKKKIAQMIRSKYPDLLDMELPTDVPDGY